MPGKRKLSAEERHLRAKIAAHSRVCRPDYDGRAATEKARATAYENRCREVDPELQLSPKERDRKARAAQSLLMYKGRFEALRARRQGKGQRAKDA